MSSKEFSVYMFLPDGSYYTRELSFVDAETAVSKAKELTERPSAKVGIISKVMITDGGDFSVFEWEFGKGVTHGA